MALSHLLRYSLMSNDEQVPLSREVRIVDEYYSIYHVRFGERVRMEWRISDSLDLTETMVPSFILQPIVENAVIHGMAEKIRIRVDAGKHWVRFSVSDDGAGIPQEKLEHLCGDYMELADTSSGDKKHNMGIGLIVCRDIIKVHGGNFEAEISWREARSFGSRFP